MDRTKDATLSDMVFERILTAIHECRLPPGSVINEASLAEEYAVSRGPVREAVRRLQGVQLVTREPYFKARVVNMTVESSIELFQMRAALEGYACRLAAQKMTDAQISELSLDLEGARQAYLAGGGPGARGAAAGKAFDFHERIVVASGNSRIIDALCGDLYHLLRVYRKRSGAVPERKEAAYAEHWQILRALKTRDDDLAESLMRSHIMRAADHLAGHLASHLAETGARAASPRG
ncbi:MAG: GntR family transcriptional regulator [Chthoniobacteraceae bacterium]